MTWETAVLIFFLLLAAGSVGYLVGARPARPGTRYRNDPPPPRGMGGTGL